jgi:hypothetical protein
MIKKTVREIETGGGVLIFDDTLQEKPHSKENDLICWHYDHCVPTILMEISLGCVTSVKNIQENLSITLFIRFV